MVDLAVKMPQYWHEQNPDVIKLFPDELKVGKGAITTEMHKTNRELFQVKNVCMAAIYFQSRVHFK